ncbi:helix-turn-helix domain-containing protein [Bosea sp. (in: a-proteobacteria)]|uniref:helix-turn-helix domain-containing protein n=1 Tax=Bosea sp. (in: a-proteobacteria) TaxID=1871050 RepID=UPI0039C87AFC
MTMQEVADFLNVSPRHVRNLMKAGELSGVNIGIGDRVTWRFDPAEISDFMERRRQDLAPDRTVRRERRRSGSGGYPVIDFAALHVEKQSARAREKAARGKKSGRYKR